MKQKPFSQQPSLYTDQLFHNLSPNSCLTLHIVLYVYCVYTVCVYKPFYINFYKVYEWHTQMYYGIY